MADFLNIKDLPVKDTFEDGDNVLVLSGGKLYRCPEGGGGGGGGGAYTFELTVPCEYDVPKDGDDPQYELPGQIYIPDEKMDELIAEITAGSNVVTNLHFVDEDTEEPINDCTVSGAPFVPVPAEFTEEMIGVAVPMAFFGYCGQVILEDEVEYVEGLIIFPESFGGML